MVGIKLSRNPVFIVGSPRSGTSATVDALLAAGYQGFREGNFLSLAYRISSDIDHHFRVFDIGTTEVLMGCVDKEALKRKINDLFCSIVNALNPRDLWFDKTGGAEMIRFLLPVLEMWPTAVVIFSKRRGIENVVSRLRKFPAVSFEQHCTDWAKTMAAWRQIRQTLSADRFLEVDQYDMIRQPSSISSALARFLDLDRDRERAMEAMLQSTRAQETEAGSATQLRTLDAAGWSDGQKEIFLKHCAAEMTAFGYTLGADYRVVPGAS